MAKREIWLTSIFNPNKSFRFTFISGGIYVREYVNNKQFGRGQKLSKKLVNSLWELNI